MASRIIVIDGPRGMAKSTLMSALKTRLEDSRLEAKATREVGLLDILVDREHLDKLIQRPRGNSVSLVDTDHIFELVKGFYSTGQYTDYKVVNRALELTHERIQPAAVILVNSLPPEASDSDTVRGYLWEAKQRGYLVISAIGEVEPVFEAVSIILASKAEGGRPTQVAEILRQKQASGRVTSKRGGSKRRRR